MFGYFSSRPPNESVLTVLPVVIFATNSIRAQPIDSAGGAAHVRNQFEQHGRVRSCGSKLEESRNWRHVEIPKECVKKHCGHDKKLAQTERITENPPFSVAYTQKTVSICFVACSPACLQCTLAVVHNPQH